ncbi:MFS general substrate transporter [Trichoderma citrinoviride]|uniref:MFS general substrate transporter n=1 Tax=Trichoderma citrinoviride TaxID=58853 RepID=A0A2T4BBI7_9HYPO|nr:MFS general substrate transporter [Trichoderma citrinoviride]PTB66703.1 MFS general substrate transporter [Trichoderma citrinoviride]
MDAILLRNLVEIQSAQSPDEATRPLTAPERTYQRKNSSGGPFQEDIAHVRPTTSRGNSFASGVVTPRTDDTDLERSRPTSPIPGVDVVEVMPSAWEPRINRFRLLSVCLANFGNALSDSAAGALIPYMEKHYDIGYAVVSLIFVGQALGFVFAAIFLDTLRAKLGRAKLLGLGQMAMGCAYIPLVAAAPFGVVVAAFFFVGLGIAINVAMGNIFCGSLQNSTVMLGLLHGSYGIGGTSGPLIATALVTVAHTSWNHYYAITLGMGFLTMALSAWAFWRFEREQSPAAREREAMPDNSAVLGMLAAVKLRIVLLGSTFIFAYQGAEVSISGWVISFLINSRGGDPSSVGYVSAGFWAGITLGRFFLSAPAQRFGEKIFVYGLVLGALAFQILVWFVPNVVGDAVAVSIVGLLLGPIYPCSAAVFMRGLSHRDKLSGMGAISAFGSLGGAVAPFVTGLLAQAVGTWVLHPIVIFLFVVMLLCWYGIPAETKEKQ